MPHSHHSHSGQFCKHAIGRLEDIVLESIRQGFIVYGLTEHVPRYRKIDMYPEEGALEIDDLAKQFDKFIDEAHRLKVHYTPQISLLIGLETESITNKDFDHLEALLSKHKSKVEYIVGSIHHVNGVPIDFDKPTFLKALHSFEIEAETERQEAFMSAYFDAQYNLLQRFKPEIIGHFDLCRLYTPELQFSEFPITYEKLKRNIEYAIKYGALFEVNAAAFRKNWQSAYPGKDLIKLMMSMGVRFALSDDSHGPQAVGLNYNRVKEYLQAVGVTELWYLQSSASPNAAGRSMHPVRLAGNWCDHSFWLETTHP